MALGAEVIPTDTHALQRVGILLLIVVAFFAGLAKRIHVPYPILLVLAGLGISFLPHVPRVPLSPDLVFFIFLPPLLYAAAWQTDWRGFKQNLLSIAMLATGLVGFTVFGIAFFADHFITALDFKSGFLLGAVVAATDAVAATSIARTLGISSRITAVLEGESLLNDASGLLALEFGVSMLVRGHAPTVGYAALQLVWLAVGGIGVGLLVGVIFNFCERWVEDGSLEMVVSIIVPYVAYLTAEQIHASGVLCVVTCGLFLSRRSATYLTAPARIQILASWQALDFVLNGLTFLLIGLQMPYILAGIQGYATHTLVLYGLLFSAVLIALRLMWVFPGAHISLWIRRRVFHQKVPTPDAKSVFVVGWTGMRGVVSLAAALSLPYTLSNGQPFVQRNLILFLTFSIIFVTLVVQGLSLPSLIRALKLTGNHEEEREEIAARRLVLQSAIDFMKERRSLCSIDEQHDIDDMLHVYEHRLDATRESQQKEDKAVTARHVRRGELLRQSLAKERETLLVLRDKGEISDEIMRRVERELDLSETRYIVRN